MKNNIYYVYAYLRKENNLPYYIGKGKGNRMFQKHHNKIPVPKDKSKIIKLIDNISEDCAYTIEFFLIFILGKKMNGGILYNVSDGGRESIGFKHSKESRKKMSKSRKGKKRKPHTDETKEKIRLANLGRKMTIEDKIKMSESHKGLKQSKETVEKRVKKLKGQKRSIEIREKYKLLNSGSKNPSYGKKWINNGIENKLVSLEFYHKFYPNWNLGRIIKKDKESGKFI